MPRRMISLTPLQRRLHQQQLLPRRELPEPLQLQQQPMLLGAKVDPHAAPLVATRPLRRRRLLVLLPRLPHLRLRLECLARLVPARTRHRRRLTNQQ
jgi:hypothetical protein